MNEFSCGTVVSINWLSGREDGGDPFQVLRCEIEGLEEKFTPEQQKAWEYLQKEYAEIEDDMEEVANLMYEMEVYELMQPFAPEGHQWGSHPEGCLGFWPEDWDD